MSLRACLLLVIVIAATSCGGAAAPAASPVPEAPTAPSRVDPLDVIAQNVKQIRDWYFEIDPMLVQAGSESFCAAPPGCTDVCELSDQVCDAAGVICDGAADLGEHGWADLKCSDARRMCGGGRQACCACGQPPGSRPLVL